MGDVWVALAVSAAAVPNGVSRGQLVQRWLLGVALAALVGVMAIGAWTFAWPSVAGYRGEFAVATASDFAAGTVTSYLVTSEGLRELSRAGDYGPRPTDYPTDGTDVFHVVRFPSGQLRVLSGAAARFGWTIVWYPRGTTRGSVFVDEAWREIDYTGVFREPRGGAAWAIDGSWAFGPAPRGLDSYEFEVGGDGVLVVRLNEVSEGENGNLPPPPYDVTSEGWATSGWPSR